MRVVAVVTQLERAGAQTLAAWLEHALGPDIEVTTRFLYAKHPSDLFPESRALRARRPRHPGDLLHLANGLRAVMADADVIVAHTHYAIGLAGLLAPRGSRIVAVHHWPISRYPRSVRLLLPLLRRRDVFAREVFVSESIRDHAHGIVIPNPVPDSIMDDDAASPAPDLDLVVVARHAPEKGVDIAIRSLEHLPARRLALIGTGEQTTRLRELVDELGVRDRVDFVGGIDHDAARAAMAGHIVVVPSRWEAMPMVILEAIAADADLVVSDIPAHGFVIESDAAVPFAEGDPEALARAVEAIPERAEALAAGRALVSDRQSTSAVAGAWRELLQRVGATSQREDA